MSDQDFGNYVQEGLLGSGGMATVFLGHQKPPATRKVAIKVMHEHLAKEPSIVERFKREAAAGAAMQHEHIVYYLEYGEHDGRPYIVMEFIEGWDLRSWLDLDKGKHKPLPLPVALKVLRDVACALEHAHDKNVIHRDLKPSNVMLSRVGNVKLMDFGLARAAQDIDLTDPGTLLGTAPYMSPEQARGALLEGEPAKRSDVFSFATVAYELLAGTRPFSGNGLAQVLDAVRHAEPAPLSELNPAVPWEIVNLVKQMHEKDPERRDVGFSAVALAFERALDALKFKVDQRFLRAYVVAPDTMKGRIAVGDLGEFMKSMGGDGTLPGPSGGVGGEREPRPTPPAPRPVPAPHPLRPEPAHPAPEPTPVHHYERDSGRRSLPMHLVLPAAAIVLVLAGMAAWKFIPWNGEKGQVIHPPPPTPVEQLATLSVASTPAGATVHIRGVNKGTTPVDVPDLPIGSANVELSKDGYEKIVEAVELNAGSNNFERALTKVEKPPPPPPPYKGVFVLQSTRNDVDIAVDGKPYEWPAKIWLTEGEHRIRLTHNGESVELKYKVVRNDPAKTLILDYESRTLARRFEELN